MIITQAQRDEALAAVKAFDQAHWDDCWGEANKMRDIVARVFEIEGFFDVAPESEPAAPSTDNGDES